jgi:Flp pilus assembly protein TadG
MFCSTSKRRKRLENRTGIAIVEFAVCIPVILVIVFGMIEMANLIFTRQALKAASYEAALAVTNINGTQTNATAKANTVLTAYGINGATVSYSPTVTAATASGTNVTVTISAPRSSNSVSPSFFFTNTNITCATVMTRL